MTLQSEYFDPDTGIIHIVQSKVDSTPSGSGETVCELGLEDTDFNDVKIKILTVDYKIRLFTDNLGASATPPADNNLYFDNFNERNSCGQVIFGVDNKNDTTVFNDLGDFTGTSAFPVHVTSFGTDLGNPASISKRWKPRKMAFSNEQNAFISVRVESAVTGGTIVFSYSSIYIRAIRL